MIVTPDFLHHWRTRLLVDITKDESSPIAILHAWAYCQTSRAWEFPDMPAANLAAICRWGVRTPACADALLKVGFIKRFKRGYAFPSWAIANAQLIQKWECGKKGGRPKTERKPDKTGRFQPLTGREPEANRSDKTRQDQTGLEVIPASGVNIVNGSSARSELTKLTASMLSIKRIARAIAGDEHGWSWDNCKVRRSDISAPSLETVLKPYAGRISEKEIHDCWREAVVRAHKATVDELANKNPNGYAVACFREQLVISIKSASSQGATVIH